MSTVKPNDFLSTLKKTVDEFFKGKMDGVEVGGSKDSNNSKTYEQNFEKDDKPHPPGSPEDSAHDVAELNRSISSELKGLSPEGKKKMLAHLRTLKDADKKRSPDNEKAGKD